MLIKISEFQVQPASVLSIIYKHMEHQSSHVDNSHSFAYIHKTSLYFVSTFVLCWKNILLGYKKHARDDTALFSFFLMGVELIRSHAQVQTHLREYARVNATEHSQPLSTLSGRHVADTEDSTGVGDSAAVHDDSKHRSSKTRGEKRMNSSGSLRDLLPFSGARKSFSTSPGEGEGYSSLS